MGNIQEITNRKKQKTNKLKKTIFKLPDKDPMVWYFDIDD